MFIIKFRNFNFSLSDRLNFTNLFMVLIVIERTYEIDIKNFAMSYSNQARMGFDILNYGNDYRPSSRTKF